MRLPFSKKTAKGRYSLIDPDLSDSATEEESVIYQNKFGTVELNLIPRQPRVKVLNKLDRLKCACLFLAITATICSVISLVLFFANHMTHSDQLKSNRTSNSTFSSSTRLPVINKTDVAIQNAGQKSSGDSGHLPTTQTPNWKKTYKHSGGEGGIRLIDVDGDGKDDILFGTAGADLIADVMDVVGNRFEDLHKYCELKGLEYPCVASVVALRGYDGTELWRFNTRSEVFLTVCDVDLNQDGLLDCIGTGREGQIAAFDPRKGEVLWTCEDDRFIAANWNIYQATSLEDWDQDGVRDILIVNGGDPIKDPKDHNRTAARAIMLSGATGVPLGTRYLAMPDSKESYMSPVVYHPPDGSTPYVLFGSGGETIPGDLLAITVEDLCKYIMGGKSVQCPKYDGEPFWSHMEKDWIGFIRIYQGKIKGVMVPPVIVDVNKDRVMDLVVSVYDGAVILFDGKSLNPVWSASFSGMESYSSPAPGYFDEDDTLDFMVHWCVGAWMTYSGANASVISGKDGSIIWTLDSASMQMSSGLSLKSNLHNQDMFLFRVQGRGSKFRWDKHGQINRQDIEREKRHGADSFKTPDAAASIEDLMRANYTLQEALDVTFRSNHLTCLDDLTSFKGEVFVVDRTMSNNPIQVLDMPVEKYYYKLVDDGKDAEKDRILQQLYPNRFGDLPDSGPGTHMSEKFTSDWKDKPDNVANLPMRGSSSSIDDDDDDDDSSIDYDDDDDDDDDPSPRRERHLGELDDTAEKTGDKLCTVAYYDARTTGAISDVDGDGRLDYISVLALMIPLHDANYDFHSLDYQTVIRKINIETGVMDKTLKPVHVEAVTDLEDKRDGTKFDKVSGIFKPMTEQTWTAYLGKDGKSVY